MHSRPCVCHTPRRGAGRLRTGRRRERFGGHTEWNARFVRTSSRSCADRTFQTRGTVTSTGGAQIPRGPPGRYRECGALYAALCTARPLPTVCGRQVAAGYIVVALCRRWHSSGRAWLWDVPEATCLRAAAAVTGHTCRSAFRKAMRVAVAIGRRTARGGPCVQRPGQRPGPGNRH